MNPRKKSYEIAIILVIAILLQFTYLTGASFGFDPRPGIPDPARIVILSGNNQMGTAGETLASLLLIQVLDDNDKPVPLTSVVFTILEGEGTLSRGTIKNKQSITQISDLQGKAGVVLTLGNTKGVTKVIVNAGQVDPVIFTARIVNSKPDIIPIGEKQVNEGDKLTFTVSASDPDPGDQLTLSSGTLPKNARFDPASGVFTFSPDYTQAGTYSVTFIVSDGSQTDSETVSIKVLNVNRAPILDTIGNKTVNENSQLAIIVSATDPDDDPLTYTASGLPSGATFNVSQRTFIWTPGYDTVTIGDKLDFFVTFTVKDSENATDLEKVTITVNNALPPPVPDIRVLPSVQNQPKLNFGTAMVGKTSERLLQIYNDGNASLRVFSITSSDPQFQLIRYVKVGAGIVIDPVLLQSMNDNTILSYLGSGSSFVDIAVGQTAFPLIDPGEHLLVRTRFNPYSVGSKSGLLIVESNDPDESSVSVSVEGIAVQMPDIQVSPLALSFGAVEVGGSSSKNLIIRNEGNIILDIVQITSSNPQFTVSGYSKVSPSNEVSATVKFTPTSSGPKSANLTIISNDPDEPSVVVTLQGTGVIIPRPDIDIITTEINFGDVQVGTSSTKTFIISNTGDALLELSSIESSNSQFVIMDGSNVNPGAYISVAVKFTPSSPGQKTGTITIITNDPDEPSKQLNVMGNGVSPPVPDIRVSASSLNFGDVEVGNALTKEINIYNDGNATLFISSIKSNNNQFVVINKPDILAGRMAVLFLRFSPSSIGLKTGVVTISSNDPDTPSKTISVQGKGFKVALPDIRVIPEYLEFGNLEVGKSLTKEFRIYNDGDAALQIQSITSNNNQFSIINTNNIPSKSYMDVSVKFTPLSAGIKTGIITINSNDPDTPAKTVSVQGNAVLIPVPDIRVDQASMDFGTVEVGSYRNKELRIFNDGTATLNISGITSSNSQFTIANTGNVSSGSYIDVSVRFTPLSLGSKTGILTINSNDPDTPTKTVAVQGNAVLVPVPDIRVDQANLDFGTIELGNYRNRNLRIYNDGTVTLYISSITSNNSQFTITNTGNIPSGSYIDVSVRFIPLSTGIKTGVLTITSNDPDTPAKTVSVQGNAVFVPVPDIRVDQTSLDFGTVEFGGYKTKELRIYNDGTITLAISSINSSNSQFTVANIGNVSSGSYIDVLVRFTPSSAGLKTGILTINNNDPDTPAKTVAVQGNAVSVSAPDIRVDQTIMDFGIVELGSYKTKELRIYNDGNATLYISSITSDNSQFEVINISQVSAGTYALVSIRFTPLSVGTKNANLTIQSNDPDESSVIVSLYGDGIYSGYTEIGDWRSVQQGTLPDLNDVHFIDGNKGWVVGYGGKIAYSADGGNTWTSQYSTTERALYGVYFADANNGWAVGQYGTILRTTNGGYSWSSQNASISNNLRSIILSGYSRGWAVGEFGTIIATNDGISWSRQNSGTQMDLNDVVFVNQYNGWVVGNYGVILRTTDGGQTWYTQNSHTTSALYGVDFVSTYEGWIAGGNGTILRTLDGGQTWQPQSSGISYDRLADIDFINTSEGWIVGYNGTILHTTNAGSTWARVDGGTTQSLGSLQLINSDTGWAVGANGLIMRYSPDYPTQISSVAIYGSPARSGDTIRITVTGQKQNEARFSITGVISNVLMTETSSGIYNGSYIVPAGVNVNNAAVVVTLKNSYGNTATDSSQKVTIDSLAVINSANVTPTTAKSGDTITVTMYAETGGTGRFLIENVTSDIVMNESVLSPGTYTGQYIVPAGVAVNNAKVKVKLTDSLGNTAVLDAGQVTITSGANITSVSITGSPAKFGTPIIIIMTGNAGGTGKFSITGLVTDMTMTENQSGVYTGSYTAAKGTNVKNAEVTVKLTDAFGNIATRDAGTVTIDTESRIDSVNVAGSPGKTGGTITITLIGESGGQARYSIAGVITDQSMQEQPTGSGSYRSSYVIQSGINANNAVVTVMLIDATGNASMDMSQRVTIDNAAPVIYSVNITGSPAKIGDTVSIRVIGEPSVQAKMLIAGLSQNMQETPVGSGNYFGTYVIPGNTNIGEAVVNISLTDAAGNTSTDTSQKILISVAIPSITSVSMSGTPAKVGETINITAIGAPGLTATFSIDGVVENVPMEESRDSSGTYNGKYFISNDISVTNALLTVKLKDAAGNTGTDRSKTVTIVYSWDVNRDGKTDSSDLIAIWRYFGKAVTDKNDADVNGDGYVNMLDLLIVSRHFDQLQPPPVPGAPGKSSSNSLIKADQSQIPVLIEIYRYVENQQNNSDTSALKDLIVQLIGTDAFMITRSELLQNYPNPFNPETWIPYRLSEPGNVSVSIHNSSGQLVRVFDLGYRDTGNYSSKDKAVYWDGTNDSGEKVSSGIYFYTIKANGFSAVKKMIVTK